jgi:hypothetical protein
MTISVKTLKTKGKTDVWKNEITRWLMPHAQTIQKQDRKKSDVGKK